MFLEPIDVLFSAEEKRETEVVLQPSDDIAFDANTSTNSIPRSLQLINEVKMQGTLCNTICHYKGMTYVGTNGGHLFRIIDDKTAISKSIQLKNPVLSIRVCDDQLLIHAKGNPRHLLYRYSLGGNCLGEWTLQDSNSSTAYGCKLCVIDNQLYMADSFNQRISCYTLNGDVVRHIPCQQLPKGGRISMCQVSRNSLVFTDEHHSKVVKMNFRTGDVEWESSHIREPGGVALYGLDRLIIANRSEALKLWILNINTGEYWTWRIKRFCFLWVGSAVDVVYI